MQNTGKNNFATTAFLLKKKKKKEKPTAGLIGKMLKMFIGLLTLKCVEVELRKGETEFRGKRGEEKPRKDIGKY